MNVVSKRVVYSGRVQGVGFRYTTRRIAHRYPISGHVRNLRDGRVEVVAEGENKVVNNFLAALERQMAEYIEGRTVEDQPPIGGTGFVIWQ
jgi:acylphosphatase